MSTRARNVIEGEDEVGLEDSLGAWTRDRSQCGSPSFTELIDRRRMLLLPATSEWEARRGLHCGSGRGAG